MLDIKKNWNCNKWNVEDNKLEKYVLLDTPLILRIELINGKMDFIIQRNNIINIRVFKGEKLIKNKNKFWGEYIISNILKNKRISKNRCYFWN